MFLRVLEYYAGVLFLTSNRVGDLDEAVSSRIHLGLYYPPLTRSSTKKIFDLNLRLVQQRIEERGIEIHIEHQAILEWAVEYWKTHKKMRWNGRQIRNACQTALALAEYDALNRPGAHTLNQASEGKTELEKPSGPIQLTIAHLETVAKAYMQFMHYLHEIYGKDSERRAKAMGIRAREYSTKNWVKVLNEDTQMHTQEEEDDEEDSDEDAPRPEPAEQKEADEAVVHQPSNKTVEESVQQSQGISPQAVLDSNFQTQQPMPETMGQFSPPFPSYMPNMLGGGMPFPHMNPFGMPAPFGQPQQQQQSTVYQQQFQNYQRQQLANMAAYSMMPGSQQVPFPPGGSQPQGGNHPPGAAQGFPGNSGSGT